MLSHGVTANFTFPPLTVENLLRFVLTVVEKLAIVCIHHHIRFRRETLPAEYVSVFVTAASTFHNFFPLKVSNKTTCDCYS